MIKMGIIFRNGIIDYLKERRTLIKRPKIFEELIVRGEAVDSEIERMLDEKYKEWISRGVSENMARMAIDLAKGWAEKVTEFGLAGAKIPEEAKKEITKAHLKKGFEVAEKWIHSLRGQLIL
jgi:hypothetical protein